jgi:hypothetical protein
MELTLYLLLDFDSFPEPLLNQIASSSNLPIILSKRDPPNEWFEKVQGNFLTIDELEHYSHFSLFVES